ncbi:MAG: hypothetical protein QCI00_08815, partial [Candidatus Thermoplasmatota archaeon]|nr:hypothetical protein [Candidatus Thermoplasmatota archaeon]
MAKKFVAIKTTLILAVIIISIFNALSFTASARIFKVEPIITVTHDRTTENVIPISGVLDINLSTSFTLTGIGATWVQTSSLLKDSAITVTLDVSTSHDWVDVSITNSPATLKINEPGTKWRSNIQLTVTEKAPAFTLGKVTVTARSSRLAGLGFIIEEKIETFEVPFEIGYWGVVSINPAGNFKEISPLESAVFPIELNNVGNGVTYVAIEPIGEIPSGWVISSPSSRILQSDDIAGQDGHKSTIYLTIKPPFDFGIHNKRETFKVRFTTHLLGRPDLPGQGETITFTVQSVGISPGVGYEIPMIALVLFVVFIGI